MNNQRWYNLIEREYDINGRNAGRNISTYDGVQTERINNNRSNKVIENGGRYQNGIGLYKEIQGNSNGPSNETIYGKNPIMGQELENSSFNLPLDIDKAKRATSPTLQLRKVGSSSKDLPTSTRLQLFNHFSLSINYDTTNNIKN